MRSTAAWLLGCSLIACTPAPSIHHALDRNGRTRALVSLRDGTKHGAVVLYDTAGAPVLNGSYRDDRRDGTWWGRSALGRPMTMATYADGVKDGLQCQWWPNGRLRHAEHYHMGVQHGLLLRFKRDGRPEQYSEFKEGANHGRHVRWWYEGDVLTGILIANFDHGANTGTWAEIAPGGRLIWAAEFDQGRMMREFKARPRPRAAPSQGS